MDKPSGIRRAIVWQCSHCKRFFEGKDEVQAQDLAASCYAQCQKLLDRTYIQEGMLVKTVRTEDETIYVVVARRVSIGDLKKTSRSVIFSCQWEDQDGVLHTRDLQPNVLLPVK